MWLSEETQCAWIFNREPLSWKHCNSAYLLKVYLKLGKWLEDKFLSSKLILHSTNLWEIRWKLFTRMSNEIMKEIMNDTFVYKFIYIKNLVASIAYSVFVKELGGIHWQFQRLRTYKKRNEIIIFYINTCNLMTHYCQGWLRYSLFFTVTLASSSCSKQSKMSWIFRVIRFYALTHPWRHTHIQ